MTRHFPVVIKLFSKGKPASNFCSLLPWGKCLDHGKSRSFSFLYQFPLFLVTAHTSLYLWSMGMTTAVLGNRHLSHLLSILLTNLCQRMSVNALYGDFLWHKLLWQHSICNTPAAFAALTVCCNSLHSQFPHSHWLNHSWHQWISFPEPATQPWLSQDRNPGPGLCFLTQVFWNILDLTSLDWPHLGHWGAHRPPKSQRWRHLFSATANSVCWNRLGPKVNCEVQILLLVNQVLIWVSDLLFYLSHVSESKMLGFYILWIRFCGKPVQWNLWALL